MIIGASQQHPGLTVRWRPECCADHVTLWRGGDVLGTVVREDGAWKCVGPDGELADRPAHRWQAKRAVERAAVLAWVNQSLNFAALAAVQPEE